MSQVMNKSELGIYFFLTNFYKDLKEGIATGWWGERFGRRSEAINYNKDVSTVYDAVEYIKENYEELSEEDVKDLASHCVNTFIILSSRRVYLWEVSVESVKEENIEKPIEDSTTKPVKDEESKSEDGPDFDLVKEMIKEGLEENASKEVIKKCKEGLSDYAKKFGFKLDARKDLLKMSQSFRGKVTQAKK